MEHGEPMNSTQGKKVLWWLILSMVFVAASVTGATITILYRTAHAEMLKELESAAVSLADLMESVAQFNQSFSANDHPQGARGATLSQIEKGLKQHQHSHLSEELIIGEPVNDGIRMMRRATKGSGIEDITLIKNGSALAQPMRRALAGEYGSGQMLDYKGTTVLAGYAPVPTLGIGVVYKIDLAELRTPYIQASLWAGGILLLAIGLGALSFFKFLRPLQNKIETSEQRLSALVRAVPVCVFETDLNGHCTFVNEKWHVLTGLSPEDAYGEGWIQALHPEDREMVLNTWQAFVAGRVPFRLEFRLRRTDGTDVHVYVQATKVVDVMNNTIGLTGTITDVTQQRHDRQVVDDALHRLNEAQHLAKVGSWELDLVGNRLHWSDEIFCMFEVDRMKFGASYEAFLNAIHPDDRDAVNKAYTESLTDRKPYEIAHRLKMADGRIKYVVETCESYFDAEGKPLRSVGTVQDITELHAVEQELSRHREHLEVLVRDRTIELEAAKNDAERASRAKSEFLSHMSHELRTPMNAILGFAQVLEIEDMPQDQHECVSEIHHAGKHLLQLIDELLDLSRIESGKMAIVVQSVSVQSVVVDAMQIIQPLIMAKQIQLTNNCNEQATVLADPTRLKQILVNLLSNAAKYNHANGRIQIGVHRQSSNLRISVTDTGPGIPKEKLGKLFRAFERLGAEFTEVDGTGIGLALSKQFADLMGGILGVDSTPGEGSTFWIELPLAPKTIAHDARGLADSKTIADTDKFKVLYVEDNAANLRVVEAMFRHQTQLLLISATNGEYGLELARRYQPDAILLDIHLPGMDGYDVLAALKADDATREIPVIALSADAMPIDIERGLKAGFRDYLTKPVKVNALLDALNVAFTRQSARSNEQLI